MPGEESQEDQKLWPLSSILLTKQGDTQRTGHLSPALEILPGGETHHENTELQSSP